MISSNCYSLWLIKIVVISFLFYFKFLIMIFSLSVSIPEVPSSKSNNLGFFTNALAKINLCFSPPERLLPLSLMSPSSPPLAATKSQALVSLRHQMRRQSEHQKCWFPYFKFYLKVALKRQISWVTYEIFFCISLKDIFQIPCPSIVTFPYSGSQSLVKMFKRVDFPEPLGPIKATIEPGFMCRLKFSWIVPIFQPDSSIQEKQRFYILISAPLEFNQYLSFYSYCIICSYQPIHLSKKG